MKAHAIGKLTMRRIRFEPGESGWCEVLSKTRARIANVPYTNALNIGDLVETAEEDGFLVVKRVLFRRFHGKTALDYKSPYRHNFRAIVKVLEAHHMQCEGMLEGLLLVAHALTKDPLAAAREHGCEVTLHATQPELEPLAGGQ